MRTFLGELVVLPYDQHVATRWGEIQAYAQLRGRPRPANDSWIAACYCRRGETTPEEAVFLTKEGSSF